MSKKTLYVTAGVVFIIGGMATTVFFQRLDKAPYELVAVKKGTIVQEVSASGKVESPTKTDLRFKNSGTLVALNAMIGKKVSAGQLLAKQDATELEARVIELQADIDLQKAKLDQLLSGASTEDIHLAETAVSNAETAVTNAQQALEDAKKNLIDKLKDAYTKSDDAVRGKADQLFNNAKGSSPQLSFITPDSQFEIDIEWERFLIESALNAWLQSLNTISTQSDLSLATALTNKNTNQIHSFLNKIAPIISVLTPNYNLSKATINAWENDIFAARKNVNLAISNFSAAEENVHTKEARLKTAEGNLKTAQNKLDLKKTSPRSQDIAVYEAKISRDRALLQKIQTQIQDLIIIAPSLGMVTKISGEIGTVVSPDVTIVSLISSDVFQIKLNIAENNIVHVRPGQETRIVLDTVKGKEFNGKVATIDRAETIVGKSVYYKTTILFDKEDERIKPGMTANVWIKTATSENTIFVPSARYGKKTVKKLFRFWKQTR
jgi:HlyD family secretion protein